MPDLRPFRGLRYDPAAVPDLGAVLCPPYDVISTTERERLAAFDPRNAVHVELPQASPGSRTGAAESPYEAAARVFAGWIADGTLRRDDRPLLYIYEQVYALSDGRAASARGFFCRLRLEPYGPDSGVRPHEHTMSAPKEDRFRLLSAVRTNLSPVLLLYDFDGPEAPDGSGGSAQGTALLLDEMTSSEPAAQGIGPGGLVNRLWLVDPAESEAGRELLRIAAARPLTIADGHHRYETALRYRDELGAAPEAAFVLALLYDAKSGGLALLPWHRVLSGDVDGEELMDSASKWFAVTPCTSSDELLARLAAEGGAGKGSESGLFGLWTRAGGALLRVNREHVGSLLDQSAPENLRWLDVSVLSGTLSRMIGRSTEALSAEGALTYVSDAREAIALVDSGRAQATFLLQPTPIASVLAVAAAGEHMPAKSTYFHPKAATGLVFNPLHE